MTKNWKDMTPEEKREERFRKYLNTTGREFESTEAERLYKERSQRMYDVLHLKKPDRVPVSLPSGYFAAYYGGGNLGSVMYDYDELKRSWLKYMRDFEMDSFSGPGLVHSGKVMEIMDYHYMSWPGHGLGWNVSSYQYREGEYMRADEYDDLIRDPSDFTIRKIMPRAVGSLKAFSKFMPVSASLGMPSNFVSAAADPEVRLAFKKLIEAGEELEKWGEAVMTVSREAVRAGFPAMGGGMGTAPFDILADTLRGTQGAIMDMFRQPAKMHEAMDRIADFIIANAISMAGENGIMIGFPLHKGDDTFMSDAQFEEFYWPSLKKVILALAEEGLMSSLFAEGRYQNRLKFIKDVPAGWTMWLFDQTDMASAKEALGGIACISGNIPSSLVCTGTPERVKEYCRYLIDTCAKDGGYVLAGGASATEATAENLRAIMEAAKEYGTY